MTPVAQIGSERTWSSDGRRRRGMVADRRGRSCGATQSALSAGLSHRSGGSPPSYR
jgi:hypothetical protein